MANGIPDLPTLPAFTRERQRLLREGVHCGHSVQWMIVDLCLRLGMSIDRGQVALLEREGVADLAELTKERAAELIVELQHLLDLDADPADMTPAERLLWSNRIDAWKE